MKYSFIPEAERGRRERKQFSGNSQTGGWEKGGPGKSKSLEKMGGRKIRGNPGSLDRKDHHPGNLSQGHPGSGGKSGLVYLSAISGKENGSPGAVPE